MNDKKALSILLEAKRDLRLAYTELVLSSDWKHSKRNARLKAADALDKINNACNVLAQAINEAERESHK